ncbi:vomeronasal type-2 receptor 1-like [Rhinophrynus dorsalis]
MCPTHFEAELETFLGSKSMNDYEFVCYRLVTLFYKTLWHLILCYLVPASYSSGQICTMKGSDPAGISGGGDIMIGAVLPLHADKIYPKISFTEKPGQPICRKMKLQTYLQMHIMMHAIEEINRNPDFLSNITLGFQIYDSCTVLQKELEGTLWFVTGQNKAIPNFQCSRREKLAAVIGHSSSSFSILMAHILGLYRYPHISHYSTSSLLSDRTQFPTFFRTVPNDLFQSQGLAQLVLHFGWTWVGLVAVASDYGQLGSQVITQELLKAGACIAFTEYIKSNWPDYNMPRVVQVIKESTAKVVILFSTHLSVLSLLEEIVKQNITDKIWIASEAWATSPVVSAEKYSRFFLGTLGFAFYDGPVPGFQEFIDRVHPFESPGDQWNRMFWKESIGCMFLDIHNSTFLWERPSRNCTQDVESFQSLLKNSISMRTLYQLDIAVHVIGKALHELNMCKMTADPFSNVICSDIRTFQPWQLVHYMKKVQVRLADGKEVFFDEHGDPPAVYDIINWQVGPKGDMDQIKVGSYDTAAPMGKEFTINASSIRWTTGRQEPELLTRIQTSTNQRKTCLLLLLCPLSSRCPWDGWPNLQRNKCLSRDFEFLSYEEPLGAVLASASVTSAIIPLAVLGLLIHYKTTPIVRANNFTISCLLLISLSLCFLCALVFIGYPRPETCLLRQVTFGMVFSFCVSCVLAKTIIVLIAFHATKPDSELKKWAAPWVSYLVICLSTLLQFMICLMWLTHSPPFQEYNSKDKSGVVIVECNEGSPTAFWCILGYIGLQATISFLVAFLARQLPDSFNEGKFITFSMLAFLSVWVSFIPASISTKGKYTVATEVFAILSSSWAMFFCMFVPKCYIILFQPNMNSRQHLMVKRFTNTN